MAHTGSAAARRRGWPRLAKWLAGGGLIGLIWLLYQPPTTMSFPGVGRLPVIAYTHHRSVVYDVEAKARRNETALLLKYYTRRENFDDAAREAEDFAPALFATADTLK